MFKYEYDYKYLKFKYKNLEIVIQLSMDNFVGEMIYSAKTNFMFKDGNGDWGHAVGVGKNEEDALKMCFDEIRGYVKDEFETKLEQFNTNQRVLYDYKNRIVVIYIKQNTDGFCVLTGKGEEFIKSSDVIKTISNNPKKFAKFDPYDFGENDNCKNNTDKPFEEITKKFELN